MLAYDTTGVLASSTLQCQNFYSLLTQALPYHEIRQPL